MALFRLPGAQGKKQFMKGGEFQLRGQLVALGWCAVATSLENDFRGRFNGFKVRCRNESGKQSVFKCVSFKSALSQRIRLSIILILILSER